MFFHINKHPDLVFAFSLNIVYRKHDEKQWRKQSFRHWNTMKVFRFHVAFHYEKQISWKLFFNIRASHSFMHHP